MKKYLVIVILIIVLTMLIFMITKEDSAFPLNHDGVISIEYRVYPQDTPVFSVFDDSRIEEITNAINQLDTSEESNRSEIDKLSDNYYQLYFNMNDGDDISIEVDSDTIYIVNTDEAYDTNCKSLCEVLAKSQNDKMILGIIE